MTSRTRTELILVAIAVLVMIAATAPTAARRLAPAKPETLYVRADELKVREQPRAQVVGWLACGDVVEVERTDGDWRRARSAASGRGGWVHKDYLSSTRPSCDTGGALCRSNEDGRTPLSCASDGL